MKKVESKTKKKSTKTSTAKKSTAAKSAPKKRTVAKKVTPKKVETKKPTRRRKKKAFTLIELLAVIIILGVVMIIAIPSVTKYISKSRKDSYITTVKNVIDDARVKVNSGELETYDPEATYYFPVEMFKMENSARSPYGDFKDAYVVVTYSKEGYDYYYAGTDTANMGIYLMTDDNLEASKIRTDVSSISTDISICGKSNIVIFNVDGTVKERKVSSVCIDKDGEADEALNEEADKIKTALCKRATTLHTEVCTQTNTTQGYYCSSAGFAGRKTITYGNLGTKGVLTPGDAFDCDVNNDGIFNPVTERFYYVSPKDADESSDIVTLIYYNNVSNGSPDNMAKYAYSTYRVDGPVVAYLQLPTTEQWSHPELNKNMSRQIMSRDSGKIVEYDYEDFTLPVFTYTNRSARLLTYYELKYACGPFSDSNTKGILDSCNFMMENTKYSDNNLGTTGFWLETWVGGYRYGGNKNVFVTFILRNLTGDGCSSTVRDGVRPAIEVPKSAIIY